MAGDATRSAFSCPPDLVHTLIIVEAKMASLLEAVAWWAYRTGYAHRDALLTSLREYTEQRFVDEETRSLISKAVSSDLIAEITPGRYGGPGYVLTRRGEAELTRHRRRAA
jgi:hypothetical protein